MSCEAVQVILEDEINMGEKTLVLCWNNKDATNNPGYLCIYKVCNETKKSLIPNGCHCGETNCTGYDPNTLVSTQKYRIIDANR